jgi:hypothetical protein
VIARLLFAVTVAGFVALAACGPEDIELAASRAGPDAAAADGGTFGGDASAVECDARSASATCQALGASCMGNAECCSAHCAGGSCAIPGTCAGAGTACAASRECCSGFCEPTAGSTTLSCLAGCRPVNTACTHASDCCDLACNGGMCGGMECLREGSDCTAGVQCCSNECDADDGGGNGKCVLDPVATCRSSGDDCHSGGSGTCCSGVCDSSNSSNRCDPGPGPCRALGTVCASAADCCPGAACADDGTGRTVCTSASASPLPDGASCVASFECTSGSCIGNPPRCGTAPANSPCFTPQ